MTQRPTSFALGGGLDLVSPALAVPSGRLIAALNYEPLAEGYGRVAGYERFDGTRLPSSTRFWALPFSYGFVPIAAGTVVTGSKSGATGHVLLEPAGVTGSWAKGSAAGTLVLGDLIGTFSTDETLRIGGVAHARTAGVAAQDDAPTEQERRSWSIAARERRRSLVGKVPGVGPVRGVAIHQGQVVAWRDQSATEAGMFRATAGGWVPVGSSWFLPFSEGFEELAEGDVVTQGGATASVHRVVRQAGSYSEETASGYLVLTGKTGSFAAGELRRAGLAVATLTETDKRVGFAPGGRYTTIGHNFYGAANRFRLYGAYGAGAAFEFDGSHVAPILTGMIDDRPTRVAELAQHLILTFPGGSLQFSEPGEPLSWDPVVGAGEVGLGTDITDVLQATETAVVVFGQNRIATLSGRDLDSFQLEELTEEAGADPWTAQRVGTTVYLDRRGLRSLSATAAFGNFKTGTITEVISPYMNAKRAAGAVPVLSVVSKTKSHYRLYWSDRTGLSVFMGRKVPEAIPFALGGMQPFCGAQGEMDDGTEAIFIGGEDGFVYRMDSGPSFDGAGVRGFAMLPYNHLGSVMLNKRFHAVALEMVAGRGDRIGLSARFDYDDGTQPADGSRSFIMAGEASREFAVVGGGGAWDSSTWDAMDWQEAFSGIATAPIDGIGRNVSILVGALSDPIDEPHILQGCHIHWSPRGTKRIG